MRHGIILGDYQYIERNGIHCKVFLGYVDVRTDKEGHVLLRRKINGSSQTHYNYDATPDMKG